MYYKTKADVLKLPLNVSGVFQGISSPFQGSQAPLSSPVIQTMAGPLKESQRLVLKAQFASAHCAER